MTTAERLAEKCPTCHVVAGAPCIDPKGDATPRPHKTRGPGQYEKHLAEEIARKAAREKASYGPMFAELAEAEVRVPSVEEAKLRRRMEAAHAPDAMGPVGMKLTEQANSGMEWIRIHDMLNEIDRRCGERWYKAIRAAVLEGFGNGIEYVPDRLRSILTTTEPYTFAYFRVEDDTQEFTKVRVVPAMTWAPAEPLMTPDQFATRFKRIDHFKGLKDAPEPDDGGLFERLMSTLRRAAA